MRLRVVARKRLLKISPLPLNNSNLGSTDLPLELTRLFGYQGIQ